MFESRKFKRLYVNGRIFTADPRQEYASAMLVENGRISWIGAEADVPRGFHGDTVDLRGRRVLPGFIDAHMHPVMLADFSQKISVLPPNIHSIAELIDAVRDARAKQGPGDWIHGWGYDEGKLTEHRPPTRYDLDKGCSDAPVSIIRTCNHMRCVNSRALELAGITRDTPDPPGGQIDRDESGEPTGILRENARNLVLPFIPETTLEQKADLVAALGQLLLFQGITAICDMGNLEPGDNYDIYKAAVKKGFRQTVGMYYMWDYYMDDPNFHFPEESLDRRQQIFSAGLKLIGDGSVSGRTAWMNSPYLGSDQVCGLPVCSDQQLETAIQFCKRYGCQLSVHAMGGRAIDRIVARAVQEKKWTSGPLPHLRLEHVTEPSAAAIRAFAKYGYAVVTQPIFLYSEVESYLTNLGEQRMKKTYPVRTMLDAGVSLCFSTDAPATSWAVPSDPFPCLKGGVTRTAWDGTDCGPEQSVDVKTAIQLYTRESARIAGFPDLGQLTPGYRANFITLNEDILGIDPMRIDQIHVAETYIDGEKVYEEE